MFHRAFNVQPKMGLPQRIIIVIIVFASIIGLTACGQISYYYQATKGQLSLLSKRQLVQELLTNPDTAEDLRKKLTLAEEIRCFGAQRLALEHSKGFTQYADLGRKYVTWNVVAAPQYSTAPKTWCFPIAGCVAYKGFFKQAAADREADTLRQQGYDVLTYGVSAYSTLGWFDDPLLNTFIHYKEANLAALIFHELAHQIVYVKDDSGFNEAFATAVEIELLNQWLDENSNAEEIDALQDLREKQNKITEMVLNYRDRLETAYGESDRAKQKIALFSQMRKDYEQIKREGNDTPYYNWWFSQELDNADLVTVSTYYQLVPAFRNMIDQAADLIDFFHQVKELSRLDKEERDQALMKWSNQ